MQSERRGGAYVTPHHCHCPAAEDGTLFAPARKRTENRWLCQLYPGAVWNES